MTEQLLKWAYNGEDRWSADSVLRDDEDCNCEWHIEVCEDGEFIVGNSDGELLDGTHMVYWALRDAKAYCEGRERELREFAKLDDSPQEDTRKRDLAMLESLRIRELEKRLAERTELVEELLRCVDERDFPDTVKMARKELQS